MKTRTHIETHTYIYRSKKGRGRKRGKRKITKDDDDIISSVQGKQRRRERKRRCERDTCNSPVVSNLKVEFKYSNITSIIQIEYLKFQVFNYSTIQVFKYLI